MVKIAQSLARELIHDLQHKMLRLLRTPNLKHFLKSIAMLELQYESVVPLWGMFHAFMLEYQLWASEWEKALEKCFEKMSSSQSAVSGRSYCSRTSLGESHPPPDPPLHRTPEVTPETLMEKTFCLRLSCKRRWSFRPTFVSISSFYPMFKDIFLLCH